MATLLCNAGGRIELANQSAGQLLGGPICLPANGSAAMCGVLGEQILRQLRDTTQLELQAQREDGTPIPVAVSLTSFRHDDALYYVINLLDLQARKRDDERFRNVVEASPNAFVFGRHAGLHRDGQSADRAAVRLHAPELLGQPVELLLPEALRDAHRGAAAGLYGIPSRDGWAQPRAVRSSP